MSEAKPIITGEQDVEHSSEAVAQENPAPTSIGTDGPTEVKEEEKNPPMTSDEGPIAAKGEEKEQQEQQPIEESNVKEEEKEIVPEKAVPQLPIDENEGSVPPPNRGGKKGQKQPLATLSASENVAPTVRASKRIREKPLVQYVEGVESEQPTATVDGSKKKKKLALTTKADKKPPAGGKRKSLSLEEHVAKYTVGHEIVLLS